ncbi:MAG: hypothetical protein RI935_11 [Candidatus Parcubacteria bacterium]|jgi:hypothetical protein
MYKALIVFCAALLLGSAFYYFKTGDGGLMLERAVTQTISKQEGVTLIQLFSGNYKCEADDGCSFPVELKLYDDTSFELLYNNTETQEEVQVAEGIWGVGSNNKLILIVDRQRSAKHMPKSIYGVIDTLKIKNISSKATIFEWIKNPTFTRVSNDLQKNSSTEEESF